MRALPALCLALAIACGRIRPDPLPPVFPLGTLWTVTLPAAVEPPLALDEQRVFAATRDGGLHALSRSDGGVQWTAGDRSGVVAAGPGALILRSPDGTVRSLQPRAGGVRWSASTGVQGTLPAVIDRELVFVAGAGLVALDGATGRTVWTAEPSPLVTALPVAAGPRLLIGESDGTLRCRDRATGVSLWTFKTEGPLLAPPMVDERSVLLGTSDRRLLELSLDKGRLRWRVKVGADVTAPAAVSGRLALFTAYDATLYALKRGHGDVVWRAALPSRPLSGPLVSGRTALVACHENELVGFGLADGKPAGSLKLPAEIRTPPVLADGRVYLGLRDATVRAFVLGGL